MTQLAEANPKNFSATDMLFGDLPLSYWGAIDSKEVPWTLFKKAKKSLEEDKEQDAIDTLNEIINMPGLESRQYLQAYYFLNEINGLVDGPLKIFGVVIEISMPEGHDVLAVYADHSARYFNYSGKSIIWDTADKSLDTMIDDILLQGAEIVKQIGPWDAARPALPGKEMARLNFLTSHGLHFGEAKQAVLFNDPLAAKTMYVLVDVMQELINKTIDAEPVSA